MAKLATNFNILIKIEEKKLGKNVQQKFKHCQRHNRSRVLNLRLESFLTEINLKLYQLKRIFKLQTPYPGSVVPLAKFFSGSELQFYLSGTDDVLGC